MDSLIELITSYGLLKGSFSIMVFGAIVRAIWVYVPRAFAKIKSRYIMTVSLGSQEMVVWFNEWLAQQEYGKKCKIVTANLFHNYWNLDDDVPKVYFTPDDGTHVMWVKGRLIWITKGKSTPPKHSGGLFREGQVSPSGPSQSVTPVFKINTIGKNTKFLKKLVSEIVDVNVEQAKDDTKIKTYFTGDWGDWSHNRELPKRNLDSIILEDGLKEMLVNDIIQYRSREKWYTNMGIPYRRGYVFSGPPGTGKSSLAKALASHFDMNFYVLDPTVKDLSDAGLASMMHQVEDNSIVLIEDIDGIFHGRERNEKTNSAVTFSGLLNAIDGVASGEGRLLIVTTNHIEKLDPALIRPGRMDLHVEVQNCTKAQAKLLFERFYENEPLVAELLYNGIGDREFSPAELQAAFIVHMDDAAKAVESILERKVD